MEQHFDLLCIGGGSGGIACARRAAEYGARVAVIEEARLGGTCVNVGCVPKKYFFYAAEHAEKRCDAALYGFVQAAEGFDWQVFKQKRDVQIARLNHIYADNLARAQVTLIEGRGEFIDRQHVRVGENVYSATHIVIACGGRPADPPAIPGAEYGINSDDFFALETQPQRCVIVGAGYIACEFACVLKGLGSEVKLVVRGDRLLKHIDADIAEELLNAMQEQGIEVCFGTEIKSIEKDSDGLKVEFQQGSSCTTDAVIWALGRTPQSDRLNIAAAGLRSERNGFIAVDEWQNTSVSGIYAIGDVSGAAQLTPVAISAGRKLAARLFHGESEARLDPVNIPSVMFTHPPIAYIGMSEQQARAAHPDKVKVYRARFVPMSRSFSQHKFKTFMKLICLGKEERVVGLHMIGDNVDEMLQGFAVAIKMGATKRDFDATIAIHPTSAEELVTLR